MNYICNYGRTSSPRLVRSRAHILGGSLGDDVERGLALPRNAVAKHAQQTLAILFHFRVHTRASSFFPSRSLSRGLLSRPLISRGISRFVPFKPRPGNLLRQRFQKLIRTATSESRSTWMLRCRVRSLTDI